MKVQNTIKTQRSEAGIALLISIFILLLLSVVAIALIVSSGTESALAGNYRSSTGVYYAALSGLEEARGRLLPKSPSSFKNTAGSFLPAPGAPLPIGSVAYVINPVGSETIAPVGSQFDLSGHAVRHGVRSRGACRCNRHNHEFGLEHQPAGLFERPGSPLQVGAYQCRFGEISQCRC